MQGRALYNSCTLIAPFEVTSPNPKHRDSQLLLKVYAHELFHAWNGYKTNTLGNRELAWFLEGVTEYYALIFSLRCGIFTKHDFETAYNELMQDYYLSSYSTITNKEMAEHYYTNKESAKIAYTRGCLFAFLLNKKIEDSSGGVLCLDDFVKALFHHIIMHKKTLTLDLLENVSKIYVPNGIMDDFKTYIERGELLPSKLLADSVTSEFCSKNLMDV